MLEDITGGPITIFRGPVFRISGATLAILDELGYRADCSVNSQRLGFFGSDPWSVRSLFAPRKPYHPSAQSPFRRGDLRLWEIPLSAWLIPFMTSTLQVCRPWAMQQLFRAFALESRRSGKPVMYMLHPEDLLPRDGRQGQYRFQWRHLWPSHEHGFVWRFCLYEMDWTTIAQQSAAFVRSMCRAPGVTPMTVQQYVDTLTAPAEDRLVPVCAA